MIHIYCITHNTLDFIEKLDLIPSGVGEKLYPKNYIDEKNGTNICYKNPYYGELTFHYWFWKNKLNFYKKNDWFGVCHYRRFFVKDEFTNQIQNANNRQGFIDKKIDETTLKSMLVLYPKEDWHNYDVILCEPINLQNAKKMKIIKRGFRSLIKNPLILFDKKKHNIRLQFEMSHGFKNLDLAIDLLPNEDKKDFEKYVDEKTALSPNCMYISNNPEMVNKFYQSLFTWLENCENIFGLKNTNIYGTQRIYTFLTERYLPFWFEKYCKVKYSPWLYFDFTKVN